MANEIKFIFTGDTAGFDAAINKVVKKANEAKASTQKQTEAQKVQVKLQKLLNEEYNRAAKTTASISKLNDQIKRTEQERLKLAKRLEQSSLTRQKRLRAIVELSKAEARLAGLTAARRGARGAAGRALAGRAGGAALGRMGLSALASAGGAAAGAGALAGLSATGIGLVVAGVVAAIASVIIAFKILKGAVQKAVEAIDLQKTAALAGKTVEQVQAEQAAGTFGGDADQNMSLFKELGLIIDKEIIDSLAKSGKVMMAFAKQMANVLMPLLEKIARVLRNVLITLGGSIAALNATMAPVLQQIRAGGIFSATPIGFAYALGQMDPSAGGAAYDQYQKNMEALMNLSFGGGGAAVEGVRGRIPTDALARIGIFKGQKDSELQTLKANLAAVQSIQGNTNGLIPAITNA